jgi:hypothetical protein
MSDAGSVPDQLSVELSREAFVSAIFEAARAGKTLAEYVSEAVLLAEELAQIEPHRIGREVAR